MNPRFAKIHKKGTGTKMAKKNWTILKNLTEKKFTIFLIQWPSDNWLGALDHLDISLVDDRYKKHGKIRENLLLSQGLAYINPALW